MNLMTIGIPMWIQELLTELLSVRDSGNSKNLADNSEVIDQFYHF